MASPTTRNSPNAAPPAAPAEIATSLVLGGDAGLAAAVVSSWLVVSGTVGDDTIKVVDEPANVDAVVVKDEPVVVNVAAVDTAVIVDTVVIVVVVDAG